MARRLAVLISGTGRNLEAILTACRDGRIDAEPVLVLSNRPDAAGLERAARFGVPATCLDHTHFADREAFDRALARSLADCDAEIIALAGFMRILTPGFIAQFAGRLFNIHPSLLPRHRGLHTHRRVLAAGETWHGASVHFVTEELDAGAVIKQGRIRVRPDDDETSLARRVLQEVELQLYPEVLSWAAAGRLRLEGGRALLDDRAVVLPPIGEN